MLPPRALHPSWLLFAALAAPLLLGGCAHLCVGTPFEERSVPGGQLLDLDVPLALIEVDPQAAVTARGQLLGPEAKELLAEFTELAGDRSGDPQLDVLEAQTPPAYLEELRALAAASGIDNRRLLASNLLLDLQCTAVAAWGPRTRSGELIALRAFAEDEDRPLRERQLAAARLYWLSGFASIGGVGAVGALGKAHAPRSEELRKALGEPPTPWASSSAPG